MYRHGFAVLFSVALFLILSACSPTPSVPAHGTYATLLQALEANDLYGALERLEAGADLYETNAAGLTPLLLAVEQDQPFLVDALVKRGVPLGAADRLGNTALHLAAAEGRVYMISDLCARGLSPDARNAAQQTPLHTAALENQAEAAQQLIDCGADPRAFYDNNAYTMPVYLAASRQHWEVVGVLRDLGNYDLVGAVTLGDLESVRIILERVPTLIGDTDGQRGMGFSLLQLSLLQGHIEIAEYLFDAGAELQPYNDEGIPLIFMLADRGQQKSIELMLSKGFDVNISPPSVERNNVLHHLAPKGSAQLAELLISHGAKVNHRNKAGNTPLHAAALHNRSDLAEVLLKHGAKTDMKNASGSTAADMAPPGGPLKTRLQG